jgi:hypothetical protein
MSKTEVQSAIRMFAARDFRNWHGLAPEISLPDLAAMCEGEADLRTSGWLGESHRGVEFVSVNFTEYEMSVRVWLEPGQDRILLMDTESPSLKTDVLSLLRILGAPASKLDSYLGTFRLVESEWVFPSRGLTLYLNPETETLLRLAVYATTDLENYCRNLRLDLKMRRLPLRKPNEIDASC